MKYLVTGFIPCEMEVEAGSENEAIASATEQFDPGEFVSYKEVTPVFKKAVLRDEAESEEIDESYSDDEEDEE